MARKRKTLTPTQQAYRKQVRRIKQFIRRAEKRGYQFSENVLPQQPKRITKQSVERLRKLTPEQLYKKAEYGGQATYGELVAGTKGRELERKASAQKALETRRARQQLQQPLPKTEYDIEQTLNRMEDYDYSQPSDYDFTPDVNDIEDAFDYLEDTNEPNFEVQDRYNRVASFWEKTVVENYVKKINDYNPEARDMMRNWILSLRQQMGDKAVAKMLQDAQQAGVGIERKDTYSMAKVQEYIGAMMDYLPEAGDFTKQEIMDALEYEESYEEPI